MPESTTPTRTAPYTGEEYLESLRDDRAVYIDGERVKDVTDHPAFRNAARSVARLYDAMHDPALRDVMTAEDRHGIHTHRFFMPSYTCRGSARIPRGDRRMGAALLWLHGAHARLQGLVHGDARSGPGVVRAVRATADGGGIATTPRRRCSSTTC